MPESFKNSYKAHEKNIVALSVYNVGFQKCESLYQWGPGIRDHYLIHYVVSGKGYYVTPQGHYTLTTGDVFLVYPRTEITYYADADDPWEYYWVGFNGSDAAYILKATTFSPKTPVIFDCLNGDRLKDALYDIYHSTGGNLDNALEMTGRLYIALSWLTQSAPSKAAATDIAAGYIQKAVEYISGNYAYPISVEDIARYAGISRSQLYRTFSDRLNISPKEYLTDFRIRQACQLLKTTDLSINAIARSTGFEDNLYFSKVFRQQKKETPTQYRRSHFLH